MKNYSYIFIVVLIILSVSVTAVKPIQSSAETIGLVVEQPVSEFIKQNQEGVKLHIHVFNASTGLPVFPGGVGGVNCSVHLYNGTGSHILEETMRIDGNGEEWALNIASGNFSSIGLHSFIIWCNNTNEGGFVRGSFEVTNDGLDNTPDAGAALPVILFMLFGIIGLFVLGFTGKFNKHEIVNLVLQRGCIVTAIMLMMYTSTLLLNIVTHANLDILSREMIFLMTWIGWAGYVASVYLVIQTLFDILSLKKQRRAKKDGEVDY